MERRTLWAIVGFVAVVPALMIVVTGLTGTEQYRIIEHPLPVIGGLLLGLAINVFSVVDGNVRFENQKLVGAMSINLKDTVLNLAVVAVGAGLLGAIAIYLFLENFQPFKTYAQKCTDMFG